MEPTIYKPSIYKGAGVYKEPSIYKGRGVYNDGLGGGGDYKVIGGRTYRTVIIDSVEWLAENLDFKFCTIGGEGTPITPNAWYYNNDETNYGIDGTRKCGLLYNWHAVKFLDDNRATLCPGWHVPTNDEWTALATAAGGASVAGAKLKADNVIWAPNWGGTNEYGFGVLPAGFYNGSFGYISTHSFLWTITESAPNAYYRRFFEGNSLDQFTGNKNNAYSLRLVRD